MPAKEEKKDDKKEEAEMKDAEKKDESSEMKDTAKEEKKEEVEYETKIKVKTTESKCKFTVYENPAIMTGDKLQELIKYEKTLQTRENAVREIAAAKNDCEARSYDFKRRVDEDLATFTTAENKSSIVA